MRMRVLKYYIERRPRVWWHVDGRKRFDLRYSPFIRAMWQVGNYHP